MVLWVGMPAVKSPKLLVCGRPIDHFNDISDMDARVFGWTARVDLHHHILWIDRRQSQTSGHSLCHQFRLLWIEKFAMIIPQVC